MLINHTYNDNCKKNQSELEVEHHFSHSVINSCGQKQIPTTFVQEKFE